MNQNRFGITILRPDSQLTTHVDSSYKGVIITDSAGYVVLSLMIEFHSVVVVENNSTNLN
jgi:hypothetical protein